MAAKKRAESKAYYAANREKILERRAANRERNIEYQRAYRAARRLESGKEQSQ
jgi:hypothetical protein